MSASPSTESPLPTDSHSFALSDPPTPAMLKGVENILSYIDSEVAKATSSYQIQIESTKRVLESKEEELHVCRTQLESARRAFQLTELQLQKSNKSSAQEISALAKQLQNLKAQLSESQAAVLDSESTDCRRYEEFLKSALESSEATLRTSKVEAERLSADHEKQAESLKAELRESQATALKALIDFRVQEESMKLTLEEKEESLRIALKDSDIRQIELHALHEATRSKESSHREAINTLMNEIERVKLNLSALEKRHTEVQAMLQNQTVVASEAHREMAEAKAAEAKKKIELATLAKEADVLRSTTARKEVALLAAKAEVGSVTSSAMEERSRLEREKTELADELTQSRLEVERQIAIAASAHNDRNDLQSRLNVMESQHRADIQSLSSQLYSALQIAELASQREIALLQDERDSPNTRQASTEQALVASQEDVRRNEDEIHRLGTSLVCLEAVIQAVEQARAALPTRD